MSFDSPLPPYNASDPSATFLNSSCLDLLLIELVPMAYRVVNEVDATGLDNRIEGKKDMLKDSSTKGSSTLGTTREIQAAGQTNGSSRKMDEEEERDAVFFRLEMLGYRVGQGLVERCDLVGEHISTSGGPEMALGLLEEGYTNALADEFFNHRFSRDRPRFTDTLDVIKFLCKDLWMLVFRKQIDNLKTNHRGVYVLTDNSFRPFARMSTEAGGQAVVRAQPFLWFPCGIIRGALASMGINATVQAETSELPGATFQIKSIPAKP